MPDAGEAACHSEAASSHRGWSRTRRRQDHYRATDPLVLPALLAVAPSTARFAFARSRLAQDAWVPAYKLSCGRLWWRCLRLAAERGQLHPCGQRLAKHLSWQLEDGVGLTDVRALLERYAAYHQLSVRTGWIDWARLVEAGWLAPTQAPANQGPSRPQGPASGRAARYVLTIPAALAAQLQARSRRPAVTSLDTFSLREASPSPSVPPPRHDHRRGWVTLDDPTVAERRDASALLAGCHPPWRRQRPSNDLLTRQDWARLLPLVAQVQRQHPHLPLTTLLTDRVASARHLPSVLAWRCLRLLRAGGRHQTGPDRHLQLVRPGPARASEQDPEHRQHLRVVRGMGGPAAVRAALAAVHHPAR